MAICFRSKPTAAALLALYGLAASPLLADGKFIVQPSMHKPAAVAPQPSLQPLQSPQGPEPEKPATGVPMTQRLSFESLPAPAKWAPSPASLAIPSPRMSSPVISPPVISPPMISPPVASASSAAHEPQAATNDHSANDTTQGLQWIARGTDTRTLATGSLGTQALDAGIDAGTPQPIEPQAVPAVQVSDSPDSAPTAGVPPYALPGNPESRLDPAASGPFSLASSRAIPLRGSAAAAGSTSATPGGAAVAQDDAAPSRAVLASLVSSQIISGRPAADEIGRSVHSIDNPPGWHAIGEELSQRLEKCEALINRRAYYSAREDAESAMLYLVRVLDLMSNHYHSEPAWHAASKAMSEAEDFSSAQRLTSDSDFLRRIILSHETPVLKDADATTLAPLAAAQHYRQYAEDKLVEAAQGHPWASEVLCALGRSYQSQADASHSEVQQSLRWRAIILYRGARGITPANAKATNQLGFVLLQMDRPADAREALLASIGAAPSVAAFENLVEACRRLADSNTGNWAMQQLLAAKPTLPAGASTPEFLEVDPRTFAAMSPYSIGPNPQSHVAPAASYRTALSPAN